TEMAELGATMEIPMGAAATPSEFEYGDALKVDEKAPGQWDPNAMTMPNLSWGADAEHGGGNSAAPPPLDPEVHLQPVQSLTGSSPTSDTDEPPITADETGNLGMNRYLKYGLLALMLVGLSAGAYYASKAFLQSNEGPSTESPASIPTELTTEQPEEPQPDAKPEPPADAPIVFLVVDPQPRHKPIRVARRTIELDAFLRPLTRAEKRQLAREEKFRQAKAKAAAKLEAKQNRAQKKVIAAEKTPAPAVADLPLQPSEPPKPVGPKTYDEFMNAAREAQKAKKYRIAIEYLKAASAKNPKSVEPVAKLGWAYLGAGNATQAILKFSEAKRKNPAYRDTYVGLAKSLERAGRTDDAIAVYKQYLRMCPSCRKAKGVRASLMRLGAEL
ncbi:MAG: tetratricopeptide repeat protein, partial [Myxococcota bacterium]|nr:tetratricopeptide repeat protein [Myxococcota bacterium]